MSWIKRISFFLLTNLAVVAVVSVVLSVFNVAPYLTGTGLDLKSLLIFSALFGFTGSLVSLFLSKWMAKRAFDIVLITEPRSETERFLVTTVRRLADRASIAMPEVGIYASPEANAFATGWNKNAALVAVSSGLLESMTHEEVEGVLGHEVSHVANGDMVTLALIQGVVNTFVIFFARVAAYVVQQFLSRDEEGGMSSFAYHVTAFIFELCFGVLASMLVMAFSRHREYRADRGSATLMGGSRQMISALEKLAQLEGRAVDPRGTAFASMKIADRPSRVLALFSSHPPLAKRIEALHRAS